MLYFPGQTREISEALWPRASPHYYGALRWAKSRDSSCRIASESYRCDSNRWRSLELTSPPKTQELVLIGPAFVALRFESRDWRSFNFIGVISVPRGTAEWPARVGRVRWTLAICDWRFGPSKRLHTHFYYLGMNFQLHRTSVTQGFLARILCVIRRLHKALSANTPIRRIDCLGITFPITHTHIPVTQKNCFRIVCVIIFRRTVLGSSRGPCYQRDARNFLSVNLLSANFCSFL